jgi:DNA-nicking Smr family endonuclease
MAWKTDGVSTKITGLIKGFPVSSSCGILQRDGREATMGRRKRRILRSMHRSCPQRPSLQAFYTPFQSLDQHLAKDSSINFDCGAGEMPAGTSDDAHGDESVLFVEAMTDVSPLPEGRPERIPVAPPARKPARFLAREEIEAYASLVDLVTGDGPFEVWWSDEYVDGAVVGLSPVILKKLRRGEFSYQEYLDLHGLNRKDAREEVTRFIRRCFAARHRCVLIIPGRGLNSKDRQPVLKEGLVRWFMRAPLKRLVLAFASARSYDGGAGAFYVLLRRNKEKSALVTPAL